MTENAGFIKPSRRPGELGVHSVDSFNFAVPDLAVAQRFYTDFGLDVREADGKLDLHTVGHPHRWGRISEGPAKKLSHLSFGAYEEDMQGFERRLQSAGIKRLDPPEGLESNGIWFHGPDGVLIEIRVAEKSSPDEKSIVSNPAGLPNTQVAPPRSQAHFVRPRRLSHVLIFTADVLASLDFYSSIIGLRLSDRSGGDVAFMHGIHGSDHHMLAFVRSSGAGLHHLSWDVASIHEVGLGAMQMAERGFTAGWGLGRHVLGSNYFHYVRDPWGSYAEYSSDIDYISVDHDWDSGDRPGHDSFYLWGPNPPPDFATNFEAES